MMDRYLMRYFLAVVDEGGFSRAAVRVAVSQPTLSIGIGKLEGLVGARLFHRGNRGATLTEAGSRLLPHARRIEAEFNLALASVIERPAIRSIRLGVIATVPGAWIARILAEGARADAGRIEIVEGSVAGLAGRLERGRIDAALTLRRPGIAEGAHRTLATEGYVMMLPRGHRLADAAIIDGADLAGDVMIVRRHCEALRETSRYFIARSVRPPFAVRTTSDERTLGLVAAGAGITLMPAGFSHPGVVGVPLAGFDLRRDIGLQFAAHAADLAGSAMIAAVQTALRPATEASTAGEEPPPALR